MRGRSRACGDRPWMRCTRSGNVQLQPLAFHQPVVLELVVGERRRRYSRCRRRRREAAGGERRQYRLRRVPFGDPCQGRRGRVISISECRSCALEGLGEGGRRREQTSGVRGGVAYRIDDKNMLGNDGTGLVVELGKCQEISWAHMFWGASTVASYNTRGAKLPQSAFHS